MTDEQVVRVLAERDGWTRARTATQAKNDPEPRGWLRAGESNYWKTVSKLPDYLHSLDALQPLLGRLADLEWVKLTECLLAQPLKELAVDVNVRLRKLSQATHCLLTMPPATLAHAIASAIATSNKEDGA